MFNITEQMLEASSPPAVASPNKTYGTQLLIAQQAAGIMAVPKPVDECFGSCC